MGKQVTKIMIFILLLTSLSSTISNAEVPSTRMVEGVKVSLSKTTDFFENKVLIIKDMNKYWSKLIVGKLINLGLIKGYKEGYFEPLNNLTRAEFVTMVANVCNLEPKNSIAFKDVKKHWASKSIGALEHDGVLLVEEYGSNFEPDTPITRLEMAKIMVRLLDLDLTIKKGKTTNFVDDATIKNEDKPFVLLAVENELINGYSDNTFKPNIIVTRAEASTMLVNLKYNVIGKTKKDVVQQKSSITKVRHLPNLTLQDVGITEKDLEVLNQNKNKDTAISKIIKADVNQFPIEMGNIVVTALEYNTTATGELALILKGYATKVNDSSGYYDGYSTNSLKVGFLTKNGNVVNKVPYMLEGDFYKQVSKVYPDVVPNAKAIINKPFSLVYNVPFSDKDVQNILINESWETDFDDALMIDARQIKKKD